MHSAAFTMRNMWVAFQGGSYSRAGTSFVGFSKQTGRSYPPRMIPFQFSINQGLALEFGNNYMRVISDGAFVTENGVAITGITNTSPARITATSDGATSAVPVNTLVTASYAPGDTVTLAGGTFSSPAILNVTNTELIDLVLNNPGTGGYDIADTISVTGGTQTTPVSLVVNTTQVTSAIVNAGGVGGTDGTQTVTGTTGTGTKFQALVTVTAGSITAVVEITVPGDYTVNPTVTGAEPVTGAGLVGAQLNVQMGVLTFAIFNGGVFTENASAGTFVQNSSSGSGTGATFQFGLFAPNVVTVDDSGSYTAFPTNPVSQDTSSGTGLGAEFTVAFSAAQTFQDGDWLYISGVNGMTQVNNETYVVHNATMTTFDLFDVYGNPIDATAWGLYTSGGTAARIYTVATPYSEVDLPYLKYVQSADVMSLCCVNQETLVEYQPQDLSRLGNTNWVFNAMSPEPTVTPPTSVTAGASAGGNTYYAYEVTSVNADDGTESVASPVANLAAAVDVSATAGTITITWSSVQGVNQYNVYKATPGYGVAPPVGAQFGFAGFAFGTQFIDSNIVADLAQVPPKNTDPFSPGRILNVTPVSGGAGYSVVGFTITSATGSGAILTGVLVGGALTAVIVEHAGQNYLEGDTVTVIGDGAGATATLTIGPPTGNYPSVPSYFQQRRFYANSLNNPDTFWLSQPGSFTNFDSRIPTIDSDSITGSPWSVQVNGIQFAEPMPGGLVVLTGLQAWQLTGGGGSFTPTPITPTTQSAQPQAYNGCSATVPPVRIGDDLLYVQAKGSIYRDLAYTIATNIYTGADITLNSSQLFTGYTIREHAWTEEPFKHLWSVRDDGTMLSLTFLKTQEILGWSRHDTNGLFKSVCSVTEPPVDALYLATQRFPGDETCYMIERMDNREWPALENCWCVDAGQSLAQPTPAATLTADTATGLGAISGYTDLVGGAGYSTATTCTVVDANGKGPGTGCTVTPTIVAGVITAFVIVPGTGYISPKLVISDPADSDGGSGASATLTLDNTATFSASAAVFASGDVGSVIRMGGGIATITAFNGVDEVEANITEPIVDLIPNSRGRVLPQLAGNWTMTVPVSTISGLKYLAGATVTGLADGEVIPPTVVSAAGSIPLPAPATAVIAGLGFQAQLQSVNLDTGEPTVQGQRKKEAAVTVRMQSSKGIKCGANQPNGSFSNPPQNAPAWSQLADVPDKGVPVYGSTQKPLYTGDARLPINGGFATPGQIALQQDNPLPMEILAIIPEALAGDKPEQQISERSRGKVGGR